MELLFVAFCIVAAPFLLIGWLFSFLGDVIALPFRIIGCVLLGLVFGVVFGGLGLGLGLLGIVLAALLLPILPILLLIAIIRGLRRREPGAGGRQQWMMW
jgi:Na+/serine symporter